LGWLVPSSVLIVARKFLMEAECMWDVGVLQLSAIRIIKMHVESGNCIGKVICFGSTDDRRGYSRLPHEPG
jgi:uncharacterized membrane protein